MSERIVIASEALTAEIAPLGAELQSLRDVEGRELMSEGDPAFWSGRAPLLFPIVGRLNGDHYRWGGHEYTLPKHGLARRMVFDVVTADGAEAVFELTDTPETRTAYPFAFALEMAFAVEGRKLSMTATVRNTGNAPLPASFGYHPAFAWPLPFALSRENHAIVFADDEPGSLRSITSEGLIAAAPRQSPVTRKTLALDDALFTDDALVWTGLRSRCLTYGGKLRIEFPDTEWLGIWTKPGASFVCIEPWAGIADPEGYGGEFGDKPGIFIVDPGESRSFRMAVILLP